MGIVVQKFGGRLLESPDKIRRAAQYIVQTKLNGEDPVVVVSAPGRATDHLIRWAGKVSGNPEGRELDMLLSVGERMAMSLLALAINADGRFGAVSFTGSQVGIITDTRHTDASIVEVKGFRIRESISQGLIPIIAGFQGISTEKEITTLGRGGSDATAVALAAALNADRCELIKETGGIYSADPMLIPQAKMHAVLDYATLEEMTRAGAKVVQPRAAALAKEHNIVLSVNAPDGRRGTLVVDRTLSKSTVSALTLRKGELINRTAGEFPLQSSDEAIDHFFWNCESWNALSFAVGGEGIAVEALSVVGWGGRLPSEAVAVSAGALSNADIPIKAVFRSAGCAIFVLNENAGRGALITVHDAVLKAGMIEELAL